MGDALIPGAAGPDIVDVKAAVAGVVWIESQTEESGFAAEDDGTRKIEERLGFTLRVLRSMIRCGSPFDNKEPARVAGRRGDEERRS